MKNLKDFKRIYNIIDILEQEGIIDDKFYLREINILENSKDYNMKLYFNYSNENCEQKCFISIKVLGNMNFVALIELKYGNEELEIEKNITFMNSGLDEKIFILNTNDKLQLKPVHCYYYGSLDDGFNKINTNEIKASVTTNNIKKLTR